MTSYAGTFITRHGDLEEVTLLECSHQHDDKPNDDAKTPHTASDDDSEHNALRQYHVTTNEDVALTANDALHSARRPFSAAIETIERETRELRQLNRQLTMESNTLRQDNDELRRQLDQARRHRSTAENRIAELERDVTRLEADLVNDRRKSNTAEMKITDLKRKLADVGARRDETRVELDRKEIEWKATFERKNRELRQLCTERETLRVRLEQCVSSTQSTSIDVETLNEIESLKRERAEMSAKYDDLARAKDKMAVELRNLVNILADRENELRNEKMRHILLTRQFNSLLQENTSLKERSHVKSISTNGLYVFRSSAAAGWTSSSVPIDFSSPGDPRHDGAAADVGQQRTTSDKNVRSADSEVYLDNVATVGTLVTSSSPPSVFVAASRTSSDDPGSHRDLRESRSMPTTFRGQTEHRRINAHHVPSIQFYDKEDVIATSRCANDDANTTAQSSQPMTSRTRRRSSLRDTSSSSSRVSNVSVSKIQMTSSRSTSVGVSRPGVSTTSTKDVGAKRQLPSVRSGSSADNGSRKHVP